MPARKRNSIATLPDQVSRDEMAELISHAWKIKAISQRETCNRLNIDQSQFSRIVNGRFATPRGHAASVFAYAKSCLTDRREDSESLDQLAVLRAQLTEQLYEAWDKTADGANALSSILEGARRLRVT